MFKLSPLSLNPLVSIIVPSYNQGRFIRETIDSILNQDYRPVEIIVVDGASTDNTLEVLKSYDRAHEVSWISEPDSGVVEAVNKGFSIAKGEIGAIQSSDDYYLPGAVTKGVDVLREDPELCIVYGDIVKIDASGEELSRTNLAPFSLEGFLSIKTWIPQPSTFFRLELAKFLGGWREDVSYAADTDLWLRMAFKSKVRKIDTILAVRRVHENQRDKQVARIINDYSLMIDSCNDLKNASEKLIRAAKGGKHLMRVRYNTDGSAFSDALSVIKAGLSCPSCINMKMLYYYLIYLPVRKFLSKCKRVFEKMLNLPLA